MKLTSENVRKMIPYATVTEEDDGVRIYYEDYSPDSMPMVGNLMRCAVSLGLDPSQIKDDSEYEEGTDWGGMTGKDSDIIRFDVTLLWTPVSEGLPPDA